MNTMKNLIYKFKVWFISVDEFELYTVINFIGLAVAAGLIFLLS
jgi:hypothetical protein